MEREHEYFFLPVVPTELTGRPSRPAVRPLRLLPWLGSKPLGLGFKPQPGANAGYARCMLARIGQLACTLG